MTPPPQEHVDAPQIENLVSPADGDRVVISGMAGIYPQSRYIKDLENILYNKLNPISSDDLRWQHNHPEVTQYTGSVPDLDRFDAQFFKVHFHLGNNMDPMSRKILEQAYGAIYDAGMSPEHLSGKKVGVYIGTCFSETEKSCFYSSTSNRGLGIVGCNKSMFANRVSYWLNAKGPSLSVDAACCSSTAALEQAYRDISRGACESAIVGGGNLCLHPHSSIHYGRIMNISMDGKTKSFAEDAAGCAKSEAINVLFLQKAKDAKRIYADLVYVKSEFLSIINGEIGPKYGFYRNPEDTANFLNKFYDEAGIPPSAVEYVEAFGSAVPEVDKSELEAIDRVFCKNKNEPLLVGSVMSNIGYGEAASGISAVTKVLLGYHRGELAGNLHCETPRLDVQALQEGRMRIITDNQQFRRTYAAVNNMSVTGVNAHVLLNGHYKPKDLNRYKTNIPHIITISGRQESSVKRVLDHLKSKQIDPEELALLNSIHETNISGHLGKGYIILDTNADQKTVSLSERANYFDGTQRPLWFVYSGMGSQWAGMGAQLMRIPIFAAAIERCQRVLEPKGINIVHIITSQDETIFNNILHSFVGIAAVQIGLTDILLQLGLVPDKIIGHSVGELGCAYADGCLTAEEMILSAYSRGLVSLETPFIRGSMAAVGVGFQQMEKMCPPDIEIACHNSAESCTISGPAELMQIFVAELTAKGIFAKEVPCSNIAYHSRYIADAGPGLLKYLKEVVKTPKARSERWVSTSIPQNKWGESIAKYSSAEYHTNNLLSPVLFEETSKLIPSNAVLVEVAPHGLLQAILKRSLPDSCTNIPLTRRGHTDNVLMVLEAIGKLYMEGYNPKVQVLYPKVEFPVSTGTPCLSHYVDWAHQDKWSLTLFQLARRAVTASCTFTITIHETEHSYLKGHVIKNKTLVPFSLALVAAWDTLAMSLNVPKKSLNVKFQDIQFYVQPTLYDQKKVNLSVSLHRGNGRFEVMDDYSTVATGFIACIKTPDVNKLLQESATPKEDYTICAPDVYQLLYERDYAYSGEFRSIHNANESMSEAHLLWNDNWVTFIDGIIQLNMLKFTQSGISQPDRIRRIHIDVKNHFDSMESIEYVKNNMTSLFKAQLCAVQNRTRCGGVLLENITFYNLQQIHKDPVTLQTLKFIPRFQSNMDVPTSLRVFLQITAENLNKDSISVLGLDHNGCQLFHEIEQIAREDNLPGTKVDYRHISLSKQPALQDSETVYDNTDLILVQNLSTKDKIRQNFHCLLKANTFIINEESMTYDATRIFPSNLYNTMSVLKNTKTQMELSCWRPIPPTVSSSVFTVQSESDFPLLAHARDNLPSQSSLIILSSYPPVAGLTSLVKKWRKESTRNRIYLNMINGNWKDNLCSDVLPDVNLAFNIVDNGLCGGEYYLPIEEFPTASNKVKLQSDLIGDINSLNWVQAPTPVKTVSFVTVHYAGINVSDVKRAHGVISSGKDENSTNGYGFEFSGLTKSGERVMGLVKNGAASSHVVAQPELLWPVPSYWSLEDAATVPFAYMYAYYCLVVKIAVRIVTNDMKEYSVLIHGGAGALGQAAITVALAKGYKVFTTVSDLHKKQFLLQLFPELNEKHIGNSRNSSFGDLILSATNGKGCNMVLCCLKGELKNTSLRCCGSSSTLVDTAQIVNNENYIFGMYNLTKERSYVAADISGVLDNPKSEECQKLHDLVSEGIALGHVRPLTRVVYAPLEVPRAFRLLAASRHRGRVLLRMQDPLPYAQPRLLFETAHCHTIICGDFDPLGIQLAEKLIDSGVTKLHVHLRNPVSYLDYKLRVWERKDIQVTVTFGSLVDKNDVTNLFNSAIQGPIEGLHIIATTSLQEPVIRNIDSVTRSACPSLKYFLVLNNGYTCGYFTCIQRAKDGLPATFLDLSLMHISQDANGVAWYRGAAETVERALLSTETVLVAQSKLSPRISLFQEIAGLTELKNCGETSTSLEKLGMPLEKSSSVCALLRDVYNICIEEKDIPSLTLAKIREIELRTTEPKFEEVTGLKTFYSYVDPDELLATTEMVLLPTLTNNATMRDDEYDVNETFLCIVPGLEGHHARFRTLCEGLKTPAFVLQPGLDRFDETPYQLAVRYSKIILKKTGLRKSFYILGYETGVEVILELAAILEDHGQTGTVFCLGDGPEETKILLESELQPFATEEDLQIGVARHMFALLARGSSAPAESILRDCDSWRERVDTCVRTLLGRVSHSAQYARALLEAAYERISMARRLTDKPRVLRSRLVLLRTRSDSYSGKDNSLQRYTLDALEVHDLTTSMAHATSDLKVPSIINSYLENEIIKAFENRNHCDTYLMNADAFMPV